MPFEEFVRAKKRDQEIKLVRTKIIFTPAGLQRLNEINSQFGEASHVKLLFSKSGSSILVGFVPTSAADHNGFELSDSTIDAKEFYSHYSISTPVKSYKKDIGVDDGIAYLEIFSSVFAHQSEPQTKQKRKYTRRPKSEQPA